MEYRKINKKDFFVVNQTDFFCLSRVSGIIHTQQENESHQNFEAVEIEKLQ